MGWCWSSRIGGLSFGFLTDTDTDADTYGDTSTDSNTDSNTGPDPIKVFQRRVTLEFATPKFLTLNFLTKF